MSVESKVEGFTAGEYVRDAADPRFNAVLPRVQDEPDSTYLKRLEHNGLAVVLPLLDLKTGGFSRALAKAISLGVPVLTPYEEGEKRPHEQFGMANENADPRRPFDYLAWKKEQLKADRAGDDLVWNRGIQPGG